jgi:UDP-N-acetylmuramoylalanine--D-glutamate ligase
MMAKWDNYRVVIIGAARQGLALARYFSLRGAQVTITDQQTEEKLQSAIQSMKTHPVAWALGGHPFSLLDGCDVVCVSGGVPLTIPFIVEAKRRGIRISNDSQFFMEEVPCPTIGITGSAGKTTTTTLVGRMAEAAVKPPQKAWVGGNIGLPLIDLVENIKKSDLVVLELGSFQLELMTLTPNTSAVLNITPNHLDRHGTMKAYTEAKSHIITCQPYGSTTVLNREDPGSWGLRDLVRGRLVTFGFQRPHPSLTGTYLEGDRLMLWDGSAHSEIMNRQTILLRGMHNVLNVLAACAIAYAAGLPFTSMIAGVEGFTGVAHRLEIVRTWNGSTWINDSIATAPERTLAAIRSFTEPLVLLLGGKDKDLPWDELASVVRQRVDHVVVFGHAADKIIASIGELNPDSRPFTLSRCAGLQEAVLAAAKAAEPGDIVLLAPGGTSYDEFKDFEERGEQFRLWVHQLP